MKFRIGVPEHTFIKIYVKYITLHRNIENDRETEKKEIGIDGQKEDKEKHSETATQKDRNR